MDLKSIKKAYTLENLIEGLDNRGLLVLNVLIGQQAMKLLSKEHETTTKGKVIQNGL